MANTAKQSQLEKTSSFLSTFTSFVLLKYEKTTHIALETLRKELKKTGSKIMIVKNTILQKAINKLAIDKNTSHLKPLQKQIKNLRENTAVLGLAKDWSTGMNAFHAFSKSDKTVSFKIGTLDNTTYDEHELIRIAQLPPKAEIVGKLLDSMKSPVAHITNALKFNMQKFVYILSTKAK